MPTDNEKDDKLIQFSTERLTNKEKIHSLTQEELEWLDAIEYGNNDDLLKNEQFEKNNAGN